MKHSFLVLILLSFALSFAPPASADPAHVGRSADFTPNPAFVPLASNPFADSPNGAVEQLGEIAILEGDATLLSVDAGTGQLGITESNMEEIAKRFFSKYDDVFEEIAVFLTFEDGNSPGALAYEMSVQQDVNGLGESLMDNTPSWGAQNGFLKAFLNMKRWDQYKQMDGIPITDPRSSLYSTFGQEWAHRWLAFFRYVDRAGKKSLGLLGRDNAHWASTLQADASVMDGNLLVDNHDGSFSVTETFQRYSYLDLYGMGLIPPRDVPPFFRVPVAVDKNGAKIDPARYLRVGSRIFGAREDIGISQIVAANGPRTPDYDHSPHGFRIAIALITAPGEKAADVVDVARTLEQARKVWEERFYTYTGGRGTMCTQISADCGAPTAKVVAARVVEAGGNGNGIVEPGEPVNLVVTVVNDGPAPAGGVGVSAQSDGLAFSALPGTVDAIAPGGSTDVVIPGMLPREAVCAVPIHVSAEATLGKSVFRGFATLLPGVGDAWTASFERSAHLFGIDLAGTDDAQANRWEYGMPLEYHGNSGFVFQPSAGHAGSRKVWFTGLGRGHRLRQDSSLGVGTSTLYSPPIKLAGTYLPSLAYHVWYEAIDFGQNAQRGGVTRDDLPLVVEGSVNHGDFFPIDSVTGADGAWRLREVDLAALLAKQNLPADGTLVLRFVAHNDDAATLVEAGLDDLRLVTQTAACNPNAASSPARDPSQAGSAALTGGGCNAGRGVGGTGAVLLLAALALVIGHRRRR